MHGDQLTWSVSFFPVFTDQGQPSWGFFKLIFHYSVIWYRILHCVGGWVQADMCVMEARAQPQVVLLGFLHISPAWNWAWLTATPGDLPVCFLSKAGICMATDQILSHLRPLSPLARQVLSRQLTPSSWSFLQFVVAVGVRWGGVLWNSVLHLRENHLTQHTWSLGWIRPWVRGQLAQMSFIPPCEILGIQLKPSSLVANAFTY